MKEQSTSPSFHFELSANGEQTTFNEVEGISTEIRSSHLIKNGENPFKYKIPTPPKTGKLILKKGSCESNSKLMQWCTGRNEDGTQSSKRSNVALRLKDSKGNSLVEWTFHNAQPVGNKSAATPKTNKTDIDELELNYSFYTFSKK